MGVGKVQIKCRKASKQQQVAWLVLLASLLVVGGILAILHLNGVQMCLMQRYTSYPCFMCGSSRAAFLLIRGSFLEAFALQPLASLAMLAGGGGAAVYTFLLCLRGKIITLNLSRTEKRIYPPLVLFILVLNWIYLLLNLPS